MKCLIVDPSITMRRMVGNLLNSIDCRDLYFARGRDEAIAAWNESDHEIDLVVTEWDLPDGTGLELATELRREIMPGPEIVVQSSRNTRREVMEAIEAGVSAYLLKPVDPKQLKEAITRALERRAAHVH